MWPVQRTAAHITDIPVVIIEPSALPSRPTIILQHGYQSRKEEHEAFGSAIALRGYRVVVPDAPLHSEHGNDGAGFY
jgi:uncharacterized protein